MLNRLWELVTLCFVADTQPDKHQEHSCRLLDHYLRTIVPDHILSWQFRFVRCLCMYKISPINLVRLVPHRQIEYVCFVNRFSVLAKGLSFSAVAILTAFVGIRPLNELTMTQWREASISGAVACGRWHTHMRKSEDGVWSSDSCGFPVKLFQRPRLIWSKESQTAFHDLESTINSPFREF